VPLEQILHDPRTGETTDHTVRDHGGFLKVDDLWPWLAPGAALSRRSSGSERLLPHLSHRRRLAGSPVGEKMDQLANEYESHHDGQNGLRLHQGQGRRLRPTAVRLVGAPPHQAVGLHEVGQDAVLAVARHEIGVNEVKHGLPAQAITMLGPGDPRLGASQ